MRIGLVCPYSFGAPGGVQNHVLGLAGWLKTQDHQVSILAPDEPEPELLVGYGLSVGEFTSGGRAIPIRANGSVARVNFGFGPARRAKSWLDAGDFDAVHLHEPIGPTISLLTLWLTDRPVTATFHTARPVIKALRMINDALPMAVHRLDSSIAVSAVAAEVAHAHTGVVPVVIPNGISIADYPCPSVAGRWRGGDQPRITFLGRYDEPRKGFHVLQAALPLIRRAHPGAEIVVIGKGAPIKVAGVRFVGGISDRERNDLLATSDVYVAPQTGRESFGIVLIEALACGAPVVASDLPAFIEVLSDESGVVGRTFPTGRPGSMAQAVLASLAEPRDRNLQRGRRLAETYDWSVVGPQVVASYALAAERRYQAVDRAKGRPRRFIA